MFTNEIEMWIAMNILKYIYIDILVKTSVCFSTKQYYQRLKTLQVLSTYLDRVQINAK